ncbi:MAG: type II secretion system protein [Elusimicrobiaceae bacterium]|nr:type II secretion system protein [Elusimicrobiaceae bacterium]
MFRQNNYAFTLIELLVVVLIIGILTAVALPQYKKAVTRSRYIEAELWGRTIYRDMQVYLLANGTYPQDLTELDTQFPADATFDDSRQRYIFANKMVCSYNRTYHEIRCYIQNPAMYFILDYKTNKATCRAYSSTGANICKTITGSSSTCIPSNGGYCSYTYTTY